MSGIEIRAKDGLIAFADPDGRTRAKGVYAEALFDGISAAQLIDAYDKAHRLLAAEMSPRWAAYQGENLRTSDLADLLQRVTLYALWLNHKTGSGLTFRLEDDGHSPPTKRFVQQCVARKIPRGKAGHDELCAALLGMSLPDYRAWTVANDRHENR